MSACVLSLLRRRETGGFSFLPATHNFAGEKATSAPKVRTLDRRASEFSLWVSGVGGGWKTFSRSHEKGEKRIIKRLSGTS
jgi:hypothetical protein